MSRPAILCSESSTSSDGGSAWCVNYGTSAGYDTHQDRSYVVGLNAFVYVNSYFSCMV
jgi:hypothetical protein